MIGGPIGKPIGGLIFIDAGNVMAASEGPDVAAFSGSIETVGTLAASEGPDVAAFDGTYSETAVPGWPSPTLPELAIQTTWRFLPIRELRQTDNAPGPSVSKRRFSSLRYSEAFTLVMTKTQFRAFKSFYHVTLRHGVRRFRMNIWDGELYEPDVIVHFAQPWRARYFATDTVEVEISLVAHNLPFLDAASLYMLDVYGADFLEYLSNALHPIIHEDYPDAIAPVPTYPP